VTTHDAARAWAQRYELIDLVTHVQASRMWRAYDNRLRRTVGLRILDASDPRMHELHRAAIRAAHITDRRYANVLDVVGPEPDGELVIITEWLPSLALPEVLREPMTPHAAATTVAQAARAISSAHSQGVTHGRLRPATLMMSPDGSVRLRGHGVDACLYGVEPDLEPVAADIHGLGSLLYCCLTARWPFDAEVGMPVAPQQDGRPVRLSYLVADVPDDLGDVIDKCWQGGYDQASEVAADLRTAADKLAGTPIADPRTTRRRRVLAGGLVGALTGVAVLMGLADAASRPGDPVTAQTRAQGVAALVPSVPADERRLPIVRAKNYDPYGADGEFSSRARRAIDKDRLTAWTTFTYYDPFLGGKPGMGISVDLGAPRPITTVDLRLIGSNSNLRVMVGNKRFANPEKYRTFADVTGAGRHIMLRSPRPMTGRYVVVWFTRLPWIDGNYRGGVRSIVVRSG